MFRKQKLFFDQNLIMIMFNNYADSTNPYSLRFPFVVVCLLLQIVTPVNTLPTTVKAV